MRLKTLEIGDYSQLCLRTHDFTSTSEDPDSKLASFSFTTINPVQMRPDFVCHSMGPNDIGRKVSRSQSRTTEKPKHFESKNANDCGIESYRLVSSRSAGGSRGL